MKALRTLMAVVAVAFAHSFASAQTMTEAEVDSLSRAFATIMADGVNRSVATLEGTGVVIDATTFNATLITAINGGETGFNLNTADRFIERMVDRMAMQYAAREQAFVDSIAAQPQAVKLPSGVVMVVEVEGEGVNPQMSDKVDVRYQGRLSDGTVFDETGEQSVTFDVANLVPGFTQGLLLMKPGGRYRLVIPASQGYGDHGIQGVIPGNSALDFTITLDRIVPAQK